jgi:hypothetical protein
MHKVTHSSHFVMVAGVCECRAGQLVCVDAVVLTNNGTAALSNIILAGDAACDQSADFLEPGQSVRCKVCFAAVL